MALKIRNEEVGALARELARETGTTITMAVRDALREALVRVRGRRAAPSMLRSMMQISERCAALPDIDERSADVILGYEDPGRVG